MLKTIAGFICGAIIAAAISAIAAVGVAPQGGYVLVDSAWLNGLSAGQNNTYQYGFTAAGTTQATALQLPSGIYMMEVDTAASSTGVALPPCFQGTETSIYNNGAQTLTVYPSIANNPITAVQDTINNGTSLSGGIASHSISWFSCAKNGVWAGK